MSEPEFLTTDEAAALIAVTPRTTQRFKYEGKLAFMKMGSRIRFRRSNVLALLKPGFATAPAKSFAAMRWTEDASVIGSADSTTTMKRCWIELSRSTAARDLWGPSLAPRMRWHAPPSKFATASGFADRTPPLGWLPSWP
jgi:excisionase family DNA binding protein